jgi:hypothetical protein
MKEEKSPEHLSETGMTLKQLHHGLSDIFNINVRRIAAAFPVDRYEDAELYYIKGRRLMDEYNAAVQAQNSFGATVGRGLLKAGGYAVTGICTIVLLGLAIVLGTLPSVGGLSNEEKNSLKKDSVYGPEYDRLRRNFAEDLSLSLSARKSKPKPP